MKGTMKKFMIIFHAEGPIDMSGETGANAMKWFEKYADNMIDSGNPFDPKSEAFIKDGKVTMEPDTASGYTLLKAENLEEAVTIAMDCTLSSLPGCSVKVYETMPM